MDRSRFLAGLIGPTLVAVSASLLINGELLPQMVDLIARDFSLIFVFGIITLVAGLAVVLSHNVWRGWPIMVTVIGWLAVVGGAARILFPAQIAGMAPDMIDGAGPVFPVLIALVLLAGLYLSWQAFFRRA